MSKKMNIKISVVDHVSTPITKFFNERSLFITGATGFLGTVLIHKLLSNCTGIKCIYILLKEKYDADGNERLTQFLNSSIFNKIRANNPDYLEKIKPIYGNIMENNLGLSKIDMKILQNEVSIVYHMAANIRFNMPLQEVIRANTMATSDLVEICKDMRHLVAFVYVSTAYSNCNRDKIDEKVYKTSFSLESLQYIVGETSSIKSIINLLDGRPNTYAFSKALAEEIIDNAANKLPMIIVRPSIITWSVKDPLPGSQGINGLVLSSIKGLNRVWFGDPETILDVIPVDTVANLLIAAVWNMQRRKTWKSETQVFNCCSGLRNPITINEFINKCAYYDTKHFSKWSIIKTGTLFITNHNLYLALKLFLHIIPIYLTAGFSWLLGLDFGLRKIQTKLQRQAEFFGYFTRRSFLFCDFNVWKLYQEMEQDDRQLFDFDVKNINWLNYIENYVIALRSHLSHQSSYSF